MKRLHDEHVKETSEGITPIHRVQRSRQRRGHQFAGLEEYNYEIDAQARWRTCSSMSRRNLSRNPTHSSSSNQWEQHDDWKSNKFWNSWRSSSWTERVVISWFRNVFFACRKVNSLAIDVVQTDTHAARHIFTCTVIAQITQHR